MPAKPSELYGGPLSTPQSQSVFALIEFGFTKHPDKLAVVSKEQRGDHLSDTVFNATGSLPQNHKNSCLRWTHAEFFSVATNLAEGMVRSIGGSGSTDGFIVTFVPNSVEWLLVLFASVLAKVGIACLDVDLLRETRRAELEAKLLQIQPSCVVVVDDAAASIVDNVLQPQRLEQPTLMITMDIATPLHAEGSDWVHFPSLCKPHDPTTLAKRLQSARYDDPNRSALIVYTSGTSAGMPKGCIRHVASLVSSISQQNYGDFFSKNATKERVQIVQTANFRVIAPHLGAFGSWRDGRTIVLTKSPFGPEAFLEDLEQEQVTEIVTVPGQLHAVAASASFGERDLSSVKVVGLGGDIVTSALIEFAERCFPSARCISLHGMTECESIFQWPYDAGSPSMPFWQGIAPIGRPSPGTRMRLVSAEDGSIVSRGEIGELHVHSANVFKTYLRQDTDIPACYTDDTGRWFKTGDLAVFNDAGDVYIVGRLKSVIKRAAVTISPAAIESSLQSFTGSQVSVVVCLVFFRGCVRFGGSSLLTQLQTVVIGIPHPVLGQEPFAISKSFNGRSAEDLESHVDETFGSESRLGGAVELKDLGLESFPVNVAGKIHRLDLEASVARYLATSQMTCDDN